MKRALVAAALLVAAPAMARDSLGIWNSWGAFSDAGVPRCYAIAMADKVEGRVNEMQPYFTVGNWPRRGARGEVHVRLSRKIGPGATVTLSVGGQRFALVAGAADAWAADQRMDAAIVAAMRSASSMSVTARSDTGRTFTDTYTLAGAASAMDAALLGCAQN
ncbi:invasion associated locus B family protein [Novosphingobium sp.]|uniref:invasion associated locus B family protein n=1 Tax=Novosphingobium sp. TaxID=1874826 RepID=UPI00260EE4C4|nr:invasion associated locus B family protein [Novosphingobium sp.]